MIHKHKIHYQDIVLPTYQKRDFYKDLWDRYEIANNELKTNVKLFNKQVDLLIEKLKTKYDKPFEEITEFTDVVDNTSELLKTIEEYNAVIKSNNIQTNQFDKAKSDAIDLLKKHYTAEFIEKIELDKLESNRNSLLTSIPNLLDESVPIGKDDEKNENQVYLLTVGSHDQVYKK